MEQKEYSNGEITVIWQPDCCIHSGNCIQALPAVYKPWERPWIKPQNATTEQLIKQIEICPSGALSYRFNNEQNSCPAN